MTTERLVSEILDIAETLLISGAEVSRVEDTVMRLGNAYGFARTEVFSITSCIILTIYTQEGECVSQSRRVRRYAIDMDRLEQANALSRMLCAETPSPDRIPALLAPLQKPARYNEAVLSAAYFVAAASFAVFFGGGVSDALAAGLTGLAIRWLLRLGDRLAMNPLIATFFCAFSGSGIIMLLTALTIGKTVDTIMMGCVMLLIPGLAFTSSLRDMISGDTVTGLMGFCDAVIKAVILAIGFNLIRLPFGV